MEIVPFIYFTILTFILYKKNNETTIAVYMSALYAFSAFCGVIMIRTDIYNSLLLHSSYNVGALELNILPTFLYCSLITIAILPFSKINKKYIRSIYINTPRFYKCFMYFLSLILILNIYKLGGGISEIINGDLGAMRNALYDGDGALESANKLHFPFNYINVFFQCSILALPCFFYSICFLNKSKLTNAGIFLISLSGPISGLTTAGRTEMVYYCQMLIFCIIMFRPFIKRKQKKIMLLCIMPFVALISIFLITVTVSRFGDRDSGASGGIIEYAGQNYMNFCQFYENRNTQVFDTVRAFPLTNFIINGMQYDSEINSNKHGFFTGIFASFLGPLLLDMGALPMIIWVLLYAIISNYIISIDPHGRRSLGQILLVFVLAAVPIFGIFYLRYFSVFSSLLILVTLISYIFLKHKIRI